MEDTGFIIRTRRADFVWAAVVALVTALVWCLVYHRWTLASWQVPITYLADPQQSDVIHFLARIRAAADGHQFPVAPSNIPELGAPFVANWDDYPMSEKPLFCFAGLLARVFGLFAGANLTVMLGQVFAALSFFTACRLLGGAAVWAAAGAIAFGLSRFAFAQSLYHLTVLYYWHIPLCLLVCRWLFEGTALTRGRLGFALAIGFITGVQHVYYANLFAQFVLFGALAQFHRRGWRSLGAPVAILGVMALGFFVMEANTLIYGFVHGHNANLMDRRYQWMEVYGLKMVDLVVPPPDHPIPALAHWSLGYLHATMLSPGETPPSAYLGLIGLGAVLWLVCVSIRRVLNRETPPLEAFLILWTILYAEVGGIGSVIGTFGFDLFRTTTRYSIVILCLALMFAVRRLTRMNWRGVLAWPLAAFLVVAAWWDQAPRMVSSGELAAMTVQVDSDRQFTQMMEHHLPARSMVFQMPVMDYPESGGGGVLPYNHLRPYLYSQDLRFSFGAMKNRPEMQWQYLMDRLGLVAAIPSLENYGFAAIYVNTGGTPDRGASLISTVRGMGYTAIPNEAGDLFCVFIHPNPHPPLPPLK